MKQEDKELLLKYLCMALPYGVVVETQLVNALRAKYPVLKVLRSYVLCDFMQTIENVIHKPYLRPMSSMTLEEIEEFRHFKDYLRESECKIHIANYNQIQWLLEKHFDFMELIPKGLAIEVTEENNPYKK